MGQAVETKVTLCGIELDNPVIPASGTYGFGYEFAELYDINCLGTFSFKGTTKDLTSGDIDMIGGATISSNAVHAGVYAALQQQAIVGGAK